MIDQKNEWIYSTNELWWMPEKEYATKEEAIEAAKNDPNIEGTFWVGRSVPIDKKFLTERVRLFDIESFNETMSDEAVVMTTEN